MAKKKEDPLSLAIRIILITIIIVLAGYFSFKVDGNKLERRYQNIEITNKAETAKQLQSKFDRVYSDLNAELEAKESNGQRLQELEQEKLRLEQELQKAQKDLQAREDAKAKKNEVYAAAEKPKPTGDKALWLAQSGIPESQWAYVDFLISKESGWNPCSYNPGRSNCNLTAAQVNDTKPGPGNVACGLAQSLPCGKWGEDWTNPVSQLKSANTYVNGRYGGWAGAVAHSKAKGWY